MLEACRPLSAEELERPLGIGCGNVRQTVLHMISADMYWTDRLARPPARAAGGWGAAPSDGPVAADLDPVEWELAGAP